MIDTTREHRHVDLAIEAFDRALAALLDAEQHHQDWTATLRLADQVTATRLRAHAELMRAGWQPPASVLRDLDRDGVVLELAVPR